MNQVVNRGASLQHLMDLLRVEGLSGRESKVATLVCKKLRAAGCQASWIKFDGVRRQLPGYEIGNLIVKLPGTRRAPRRLFMGHLDTVPLCRGAEPVAKGNRITSKGETGLGADNRTACAALVSLAETLLKKKLPHPPITLLFTVGEEVGLHGAKHVSLRNLGNPAMGFNIDSGPADEVVIAATGAHRLYIDVYGRSAHAGMHPEHGISAMLIASRAIAYISERGYFGKIAKGGKKGTSNVGAIEGGEATNQITDHVRLRAETRSHNLSFLKEITGVYRDSFTRAAKSVKNHKGQCGKVQIRIEEDYGPFKLKRTDAVVAETVAAVKQLGLKPKLVTVDGGLDANPMNVKGLPTVTLGAGQHGAHTVDEYVDIKEYLQGTELLVRLATIAGD